MNEAFHILDDMKVALLRPSAHAYNTLIAATSGGRILHWNMLTN
jgi:hypothetical protein